MQNHAGFSNPFGASQNPNMNQGYAGNQSFIPQTSNISAKSAKNPSIHQSKIFQDKNPQKRVFKGKYELNASIPVKYNTVDYFMLVENVRINNESALRELKRGKASDILEQVLDSLEFLSYIHK
jgi:hypothetical protein